ncbi:MAG: lysophospholipid acyltransferase family protein [Sediminibacterium sp.]|jgi:1-acyl-sn-glycerol-3-phosphate acyltransferase|uniref:lysophospholipid acyltransferase family protein n=1 Tax=Sediminibacterium sp. TaxID=1917865 RepID=UPI002ABA1730|nr:lysophospholipid acyltransferase family protein [Sediminibacterium sp.]MDZ4070469.1 lysophospholipid acyltransferase family protein [Sediminibacterium sp.]
MKKKNDTPFWKLIVGRIMAAWALILFIATMLPAIIFYLPCFLLDDPVKASWHRHVSRVWMWIYLHLIGCPLKVTGKEHFNAPTNYVIVCNHNSLMDVPVSTPFMPRPNKTIAKKSFAKIPLFGWIYTFGSVLVDRKSDESRRKSYEEMKRMLAIGLDMLIYPEGTRNRTQDPLKSFYDGAFKLAVDTGKPILPVILLHTKKVLPANLFFYLMPHHLEMHFLTPVSTQGKSAGELKEEIFTTMWNYYQEHA